MAGFGHQCADLMLHARFRCQAQSLLPTKLCGCDSEHILSNETLLNLLSGKSFLCDEDEITTSGFCLQTELMRVDIEVSSPLTAGQTICDIYHWSKLPKNVHVAKVQHLQPTEFL